MTFKTLNRSFAAGEISPQLFSRLDLDKFQTGVSMCLNMETLAQGPVQNRSGYGYVLEARYSDHQTILIPFSYSTQQTFALEFGNLYIRFHTNGGTLLEDAIVINNMTNADPGVFTTVSPHGYVPGQWVFVSEFDFVTTMERRFLRVAATPTSNTLMLADLAGVPIDTSTMPLFSGQAKIARVYEIQTPYLSSDLRTLNYVQSADVLTIVSPNYEPRELKRLGATNWSLEAINFAPTLSPPQSTAASPSAINHRYRVVGVAPTNGGYTGNSNEVVVSNDLTIPGRYNLISWTSIPGGIMYFVYKQVDGGGWGLLGTAASGASFVDDGSRQPDTSATQYLGLGTPPVASASAITPSSTGVSVVPTGAGSNPYSYVVTSVSADEKEESIASGEVTVNNDLSTSGNFNTISWPLVPGVANYRIYRKVGGIFGLIGRGGVNASFVDNNIAPDVSTTPPLQSVPFLGSGNYPRAVSYHQQRRVFASTVNQPQTVWMTRSGTEKNLGYSFPSRDDDGITLRIVSREANTIRHIMPMTELILLTSGGEWQLAASDSGPLTPTNASAKPQGYSGASIVPPVVTNRTILFAQDRGGAIRELEFSWQQQGFQTMNVSILAQHLFDYYTVVQLAFSRSPLPSLWSVRSDGALLGMTYVPEHEVRAWHRHTTDGEFESVVSVAEGDEDVLYAVVRRSVNGRSVRYIERKHTRRFDTPADQFFVDSGVSYSGPPVSVVTGIWHLEGKTVSILADGGVSPPQVVVNGSVPLDAPASKVHVGLPYVSQIKTLPLSIQTQAFGQGTVKNVNKVHLRVYASNGFKAGPTFDKLHAYPTRSFEPYGSPPDLVTGEVPITVDAMWQRDGAVCIQQDQPTSLMVLGMAIEVATGS